MSLILRLKQAENLTARGKTERIAKVTFRGVSHYSKIIENVDDPCLVIDETFEWPVARAIESEEQIEIQLFNYNKYLSNRLLGTFCMVLQQLVEVGELSVSDYMLDDNNVVMKTIITFELVYTSPTNHSAAGGSTRRHRGSLLDNPDGGGQEEGGGPYDEDSRLIGPDHRRCSESDYDTAVGGSGGRMSRLGSKVNAASRGIRSPTTAMKSMKSIGKMMKFGKQRPPTTSSSDQFNPLSASKDSVTRDPDGFPVSCTREGLLVDIDDRDDDVIDLQQQAAKKSKFQQKVECTSTKAQDFQVSVTVIEARQLAGLNMDPVVCVQVGDQKKYTSVKESTNCPYYNEYFVFDFNMPPAMLFDKIIALTVMQYRKFYRSHKMLGQFKLDVGTIFSQPDHQFYHKWALLTDPEDINSGPKGYLKCDIAVVGKGDNIKAISRCTEFDASNVYAHFDDAQAPQKTDKDEDDIDANLLLPDGVPADRQKAKFFIRIYKAEGLPKMAIGLMANVKRALTGETKDLVDPYVMVCFAGHKGKTSVKKGCYEPVWNEQITFTEMFPPLCRRIKIQLRDNDSVNDDVIGTHFIDLCKISNEGEKGFLPTFGPCWVNLYGSTRSVSLLEEHSHLNDGLCEGVSFRGRLLISLKTEILDNQDIGPSMVELESTLPVPDNAAGRPEDFFLFGCILEANMIDKKLADKPVKFELSIGNYGNMLDGRNDPAKTWSDPPDTAQADDETQLLGGDEDTDEQKSASDREWRSTSDTIIPRTRDRIYYYLPIDEEKPCLWVKSTFEDHRRRLYNTNMIEKIYEKLEDGIADVHEMIRMDRPYPDRKLRTVLEELATACSRYLTLNQSKVGATASKTTLDKERLRLCQREIDQVGMLARTIKAAVTRANYKEKLKSTTVMLVKLRHIAQEPQHAMPDVFVWLIQNNRRIAYHRLQAKDIVYSLVEEEQGRDCAKVQTVFLKLPGKKGSGPLGWGIQAKLQMYLWLGVLKHKKDLLKGLPEGYEDTPQLRRACRILGSPPLSITYNCRQCFQLRAHMYQGRGLIGSDDSGLSDPFARVVFADQSLCTQVIDETLSPTWDEMLIFNEIAIFGSINYIREFPPTVVIEIFDQDRMGKPEFIGRALARPVVKASDERYDRPNFPPQLEWFDVRRGLDRAGELLAAFELLQLAGPGDNTFEDLPPCELPMFDEKERGAIMPVPKGIRPTLSKHRIEVLFWGVRDLKRIQLTSVDKPRIDIECAGHVLSSSLITSAKKNPNFTTLVKYFDVDLPDNELYCPPITIRCVDCRNFGRFILVGSHVIDNIHKYIYTPPAKSASAGAGAAGTGGMKKFVEKAEFFQQTTLQLPVSPPPEQPKERTLQSPAVLLTKSEDVAINIDESQPLIAKPDPVITIHTAAGKPDRQETRTVEVKKKRKKSVGGGPTTDDEDSDLESLDWWTKYHASVETTIRGGNEPSSKELQEKADIEAGYSDHSDCEGKKSGEGKKGGGGGGGVVGGGENTLSAGGGQQLSGLGYGTMPNGLLLDGDDANNDGGSMKGDGKKGTGEKKRSFKKIAKVVQLASKLSPKSQRKTETSLFNIAELKVYPNELEAQTEFNNFKEWLQTFELYRGKKTGDAEDDASRVVGKFKGGLVIYKLPLPTDIEEGPICVGGEPKIFRMPSSNAPPLAVEGEEAGSSSPTNGLFQGLPNNEPIHVLVRIYIVKAVDLHPADLNGKADPYIVIRLGNTTINDKEHYISKQLNPVFGKCFEVEATFPQDSLLKVQIIDWDLIGSDDLIGETHIDLENRYYSRHRATCGLSTRYEAEGYNAWRDPMKPTQILSKFCKDSKLDGPYYQPGKVRVGNRVFTVPLEVEDERGKKTKSSDENLALAVLHNWEKIPKVGCKLVPEHVETRPLYNPDKQGIEQGKLEMWVDMFPVDMPAPGPPVDISPRKPKSYELRIIIWNTDDVVLEDDAFFTGEKMSDIYVKGWIKGPEDMQSTDIHYRSLTGEGNFNWRFIFPFDYLVAEEKIVISRKDTLFSWDETETKIPARLNLQVWDADHFSADDFLGALTLDLNMMPRGAKSSKQCTLDMLKTDGSVPQMSLFKHKRVKGWWPFHVKNEGEEMELTGKVEAEFHLLSLEDAEKHPAGLARNEPDPLEKPNRPDTSFIWFLNPLKSIRYILWHNYRWVILKAIIILMLAILIALFFYNMPGYMVKKMLGA